MKRRVTVGCRSVVGGAAGSPLPTGMTIPTLDEVWRLAPERCTADADFEHDYYDNAPATRIGYEKGDT